MEGEERAVSSLTLSSDGVFPLAEPISALGLSVSGTLQGEGYLLGVPSLFVRLAGCNLRCLWQDSEGSSIGCDTPGALDASQGEVFPVDHVVEKILSHLQSLRHVVITGGEPLLQRDGLLTLLDGLRKGGPAGLHLTLESNGSLFDPGVAERVDLVSLSPKLEVREAPGHRVETSEYLTALQRWIDAKRGVQGGLQFKFVVANADDDVTIEQTYLNRLHGVSPDSIFVMPACRNRVQMMAHSALAVEMALRRGWRYGHRLQMALWDSQGGV